MTRINNFIHTLIVDTAAGINAAMLFIPVIIRLAGSDRLGKPLPVHQVFASGMGKIHHPPGSAEGIMLAEHMVIAVDLNQTARIVDPSYCGRIMVILPPGMLLHLILDLLHIRIGFPQGLQMISFIHDIFLSADSVRGRRLPLLRGRKQNFRLFFSFQQFFRHIVEPIGGILFHRFIYCGAEFLRSDIVQR